MLNQDETKEEEVTAVVEMSEHNQLQSVGMHQQSQSTAKGNAHTGRQDERMKI